MNTPDYSPNYSPDGLTYDDITALQREVTVELRREGHLPWPRRRHHSTAVSRPRGTARTQTTRSPRYPTTRHGQGRGEHR